MDYPFRSNLGVSTSPFGSGVSRRFWASFLPYQGQGRGWGFPEARHDNFDVIFRTSKSSNVPPVPPDDGRSTSDPRLRRLEAVLFLAREPLNSRKLSQYANLADGTEARTLIRRLNEWYDEVGRAFRVEEMAGGFRLMTRPKFSSWLRRLGHVPPEVRLSAPALETLAVVAYRQPVLKAAIEAIRGVNCGEVLRQLMERDLVRIVGRSEELGRPYLYGPTKQFLQIFGLRSLDDLPRVAALRSTAAQNDLSAMPPTSDLENASEQDSPISHPATMPRKENVAVSVRTKEFTEEQYDDALPLLAGSTTTLLPRVDAEDDDFEEEADDEFEDDEFEDEEAEELEDEEDEWEFDEEEDEEEAAEEFEEDFDDEEWEEVEGDDEEDLDEEEDDEDEWDDDDDENWEDD